MNENYTPQRTVTIDVDWFDELRSVANGDRFKTLEAAYNQVRKERDEARDQLQHFKDLELSLATKENYEREILKLTNDRKAWENQAKASQRKVIELQTQLDGESGTLAGARTNVERFKRERDEAHAHLKECERQFQEKCDELGQAISRCNELEAANEDLKSRVVSPELMKHYVKLETACLNASRRHRVAEECIKEIEHKVDAHLKNFGGPNSSDVVRCAEKAIKGYRKAVKEFGEAESGNCRPAVPNIDKDKDIQWCASCASLDCPFNQTGADRLMVCTHYVKVKSTQTSDTESDAE